MRKKQFKAESKKLLDMMINSIYTHKEIFLRELISNASDALDKLYFRSLTDDTVGMNRSDFHIRLAVDKDARTLTVTDNGIGMTGEELEQNLGTIAKSGSLNFKQENDTKAADDVEVIGQFGVGFYSAFMVADKVTVESKAFGADTANCWTSTGADGYTLEPCDKADCGTVITLHLKENTEEENYDEFLEPYRIQGLVKKYSDYIRYPIIMQMSHQVPNPDKEGETVTEVADETLNSMVPLWRKAKSELKPEDYNAFYKQRFGDYEDPVDVMHFKTEGQATFDALLYIPKNPPFDYYTKEFEKGLALYSNGVLIMEKCPDLLPDHFSFVRGLIDSADLSLNISREMLQHDRQLKLIAANLGKKIKSELTKLMTNDREKYEQFHAAFGMMLRAGAVTETGDKVDEIKDLLLYHTSETKLVSLKEYVDAMPAEQTKIYFACGENVKRLLSLPQAELLHEKGFDVLCMTSQIDEYFVDTMKSYADKPFCNIATDDLGLETEEEKKETEAKQAEDKDLLDFVKETLGDQVASVRLSNKLVSSAVCLSTEGGVTLEMERYFKSMPGAPTDIRAIRVLELNANHHAYQTMKEAFDTGDKDKAARIARILHAQALLIAGEPLEDPAAYSELVCTLI